MIRSLCATISDEPTWNKFGVRVNRYPRPNVASTLAFKMLRDVLRFRVTKAPNLITLNPLAVEIAKNAILIVRTFASEIHEQIHHSCAMNACHSRNSAKRIALNQGCNHTLALLSAQFIHALLCL